MIAVLSLALHSVWARRLTLGVALVAIMLSSATLLAVERLREDARASFTQAVSGVDLVVGARTGGVQLVLYAVFRIGGATHNFGWQSFQEIARHPAVDWAVPLSLGDNHRGFPVVGTSVDYFQRLRGANGQSLRFAEGRPFAGTVDGVFEAVLGHDVARRLGYRLGQPITLTHGMALSGVEHDDKPFVVVGILAPTGTPVDRSVHISLQGMTALHLDWAAGAPVPGLRIPAEHVRKFDLQPQSITAALVGLKSRAEVFRLQRHINEFAQEPLMAVLPGVALDELWRAIAIVEQYLVAMAALVVFVSLIGLIATLLAGLEQRRRELAILRSLGARPWQVMLILATEGACVTALGVGLGVGLLAAAGTAAAPWLQASYGITLHPWVVGADDLWKLGAVVLVGTVVSSVPGWRAWRQSLTDGLTPRL
jgi:putative ABC transport system permease protein